MRPSKTMSFLYLESGMSLTKELSCRRVKGYLVHHTPPISVGEPRERVPRQVQKDCRLPKAELNLGTFVFFPNKTWVVGCLRTMFFLFERI